MTIKSLTAAALAAVTLCAGSATLQAQETQVVNAFAFWRGGGQVVQSGEHSATFVGALAGEFYIETDSGPLHAGQTQCPGIFKIDLESGKQSGSGTCVFIADDGAKAYGDWDCHGVALVGCRGSFTLTGGTGRLEGLTGESRFLLRADFHQVVQQPGAVTEDKSFGIAAWRDLKLTLPQASGN